MKEVIEFLEKNGFNQCGFSTWDNDFCEVRMTNHNYVVSSFNLSFGEQGFMYSTDLNIYWLIGVLTYYNLIEKDYNK
jgi:hypothetical protein